MALFDLGHNELDYMMQDAELERKREARERIELIADGMYEWQPRMAVAKCDGSGEIEEFYIDVDQTRVIVCSGCYQCQPERFPEVEMEYVERKQPRKPMHTADTAIPGVPKIDEVA